jgi:two-component system response regulator HupR/HoxA
MRTVLFQYAKPRKTLKTRVQDFEKRIIRKVIWRNKWNRSATAKELGLSRLGLANKLKRYGLEDGDWK